MQRSTIGGSSLLTGRLLITLQVALSVVALVVAGLFLGTFYSVQSLDLGSFNADRIMLFRVDPTLNGYEVEAEKRFYGRALEKIRALPEVAAATVSRATPIAIGGSRSTISIAGRPEEENLSVDYNFVDSDFLRALEIPLVMGRRFDDSDTTGSQQVAVINQAMLKQCFPDGSPLGSRFGFGGPEDSNRIEIVGVARDVNFRDVTDEVQPTIYLPYQQSQRSLRAMTFSVRVRNPTSASAEAIRQAVSKIDPNLPLFGVESLETQIDKATAGERQLALLSTFFGAVALVLACLGLYGVLSYSVSRRTRELGIRAALGAQRSDLITLVVREGLPVLVGLVIGVAASVAASRLLSGLLFGLTPANPLPYASAALLLLSVALIAAYLPARRAAAVDPAIALRWE